MTDFERRVLYTVHCNPFVSPAPQTAEVRAAMESLKRDGYLQPSCLKAGALESSEKGARLLGFA